MIVRMGAGAAGSMIVRSGAGAVPGQGKATDLPRTTWSEGLTATVPVIRRPLTKVPLLDPRSSSVNPRAVRVRQQWRPDISVWIKTMSQSGKRPMTQRVDGVMEPRGGSDGTERQVGLLGVCEPEGRRGY